jgi:DNA-binding HxlR family transcriptional regulator
MQASYRQFCPIAKASEIFANRWTPLLMRELMAGSHSFNDIHRGIPLISRAVLVARLRDLERDGIIERKPRVGSSGHEYWLTPAGNAFRPVISALGHWGLAHTRDRITKNDFDPTLLMWNLRRRADLSALPDRRVVVRFEFSGVPTTRTKFRIMWLILERSGVDICAKDPGFDVDLTFKGPIADFIAVHLGHAMWRDLGGKSLLIEGDSRLARKLPAWLRLDKVVSKDYTAVRPVA